MNLDPTSGNVGIIASPIPTVLRLKRKRTENPNVIVETRLAKIRREEALRISYWGSLCPPKVLQSIFIQYDLTINDLSKCYLVCTKWKNNIDDHVTGQYKIKDICSRILIEASDEEMSVEKILEQEKQAIADEKKSPIKLEDQPLLKVMAKLGLQLREGVSWMQTVSSWWNRNYVIVLDSSFSMNGVSNTRTETRWEVAERVARSYIDAIKPVTEDGLKIVLSEHVEEDGSSVEISVKSKREFKTFVDGFDLANHSDMNIRSIFEAHFRQQNDEKKKARPTEVIILSDCEATGTSLSVIFDSILAGERIGAPISLNLINVGDSEQSYFIRDLDRFMRQVDARLSVRQLSPEEKKSYVVR